MVLSPGGPPLPSVPVCNLRETLAFLRDPALFTAGPGIRLGDFYRVRVPGYRLYVVTAPAVAEQILVNEAPHFEKSRVYWRELRRIIGDSMGSLDGQRWEYLHRLQRPFFTPRAVGGYLPAVEALTTLHFQRLAERLGTQSEVAVLDVFADLNARIVLSVLFGQDGESGSLEVAHRIADGQAIVAWRSKFPWRPVTGWFTGANSRADRHKTFFSEYASRLERSETSSSPRRLLHALMQVRDDPDAPGFPVSLLRNELTFHLGASTETQAVAEGWTLYLLWRHPEVLEQLRDEVSRVAGESRVSVQHVATMTYTKQVLQEALRLYPPSYAIVRDCVQPVELRGFRASRGQVFVISVCGLHRNPRLWSEPDRFLPDRFQPDRASAIGKYQYLPFGAGAHVCIGQHMALPCMTLAIAQFAQRFDWTFSDPDIRPVAPSSLKPSGAFRATLTHRS
ncbi:MAG: cytochrome P450 [Gemmatimonadaceae bacterium]